MADVRPIDANALIKDIAKIRDMASAARGGLIRANLNRLVLKAVTEAPTIDVEPVRHGHWIETSPINIWQCYDCSECKFGVSGGKPNYCPNCGTKMDGGESDA